MRPLRSTRLLLLVTLLLAACGRDEATPIASGDAAPPAEAVTASTSEARALSGAFAAPAIVPAMTWK